MEQSTVRFPKEMKEEMDEFVEESHYTDRSEFIRAAVARMMAKRGYGTLSQRLRHSANVIDEVADVAPEGDWDEETLAEYEAEFGEVPDTSEILREIAQVTRKAAINVEVMEDADDP